MNPRAAKPSLNSPPPKSAQFQLKALRGDEKTAQIPKGGGMICATQRKRQLSDPIYFWCSKTSLGTQSGRAPLYHFTYE